jgi:hypothetical protein
VPLKQKARELELNNDGVAWEEGQE